MGRQRFITNLALVGLSLQQLDFVLGLFYVALILASSVPRFSS